MPSPPFSSKPQYADARFPGAQTPNQRPTAPTSGTATALSAYGRRGAPTHGVDHRLIGTVVAVLGGAGSWGGGVNTCGTQSNFA